MKYIDIKKDALSLMGIDPTTADGDFVGNRNEKIIALMDNSILRAIDRMRSLGLLPQKTVVLPIVTKDDYYTFTLDRLSVVGEVGAIKKIDRDSVREIPFALFDDSIYVYLQKDARYFVEYVDNSLEKIDDFSDANIPVELARIIPYYIKADLYEDEEPSLAVQSRNLFESYLSEYRQGVDCTHRKVKEIYSV